MLKRSIHGALLDELHAARRRVEAGVERDRDEEAERARRPARSSAARARVAVAADARAPRSPATIGTQMASESSERHRISAGQPRQHPASGSDEDADDHRERVVVDVAGLQQAHHAGEPADQRAPSR